MVCNADYDWYRNGLRAGEGGGSGVFDEYGYDRLCDGYAVKPDRLRWEGGYRAGLANIARPDISANSAGMATLPVRPPVPTAPNWRRFTAMPMKGVRRAGGCWRNGGIWKSVCTNWAMWKNYSRI